MRSAYNVHPKFGWPNLRRLDGARSRIHRIRIDRRRQRHSSANGRRRAHCRRQIGDCGDSSQPQRYALYCRLAGLPRCKRVG